VLVTATGSPGIDTPEDATALEQKLACAKSENELVKYIFITGGVISSLGKGIDGGLRSGHSSKRVGLRVVLQKFDPYLNVDPGTMNPFQHGEVYVLGRRRRKKPISISATMNASPIAFSRGTIISPAVRCTSRFILKERRGDYSR